MQLLWRQPKYQYPGAWIEQSYNAVQAHGICAPVCIFDTTGLVETPGIVNAYPDVSNWIQQNPIPDTPRQAFGDVMADVLVKMVEDAFVQGLNLRFWFTPSLGSAAIACGLLEIATQHVVGKTLQVMVNVKHPIVDAGLISKLADNFEIVLYSGSVRNTCDVKFIDMDDTFASEIFATPLIDGQTRGATEPQEVVRGLLHSAIEDFYVAEQYWIATRHLMAKFATKTVYDYFWIQGLCYSYQHQHLQRLLTAFDASPAQRSVKFNVNALGRVYGSIPFLQYALHNGAARTDYTKLHAPMFKYVTQTSRTPSYPTLPAASLTTVSALDVNFNLRPTL